MRIEGFLLLAGYTARSQAYVQALARADLDPEYVILFGPEKGNLPGQVSMPPSNRLPAGIFLPNLSETVKETCAYRQWNVEKFDVTNVNANPIYEQLLQIKPRVIIYSGYGSQLVSPRLLDLGIPFLHIHAGWLPDYKGSTTLYYSWLRENFCAVSAIFLETRIDGGPILARQKYLPPPDGIDPDYLYDSAIRADLLVSVLKDYIREGRFKNVSPQRDSGTEYYVIHPVLKHLARLRK